MKPHVKRGGIKQWRFKLLQSSAAWSNSLMHSWWNVFTGGEFRCEQAVKEHYCFSKPEGLCPDNRSNTNLPHCHRQQRSITGSSVPKSLTPAWSIHGQRCKISEVKGHWQSVSSINTTANLTHTCEFRLRDLQRVMRCREEQISPAGCETAVWATGWGRWVIWHERQLHDQPCQRLPSSSVKAKQKKLNLKLMKTTN